MGFIVASIDVPDAPTEPETSEFERGGEAMRTEALEGIARLIEAARKDSSADRGRQRERAYSGAMRLIEDVIVSEPAR
ncbi:hypothetical protein LCGC14_2750280 [marine sediment metagenome]|uniref:Uncharacterized protein n=1 Tax=marine sediment metagenome TaxID=412755 RepID=A0A0F8Z1X5_9ZZZZ